MTCLDADIVALFKKRVHDMAGVTPGVKVFLDGERIKIKNFEEYCALYLKSVCARAGVGAVCVCVCKCACACVCVCVCMNGEVLRALPPTGRRRERARDTHASAHMHASTRARSHTHTHTPLRAGDWRIEPHGWCTYV